MKMNFEDLKRWMNQDISQLLRPPSFSVAHLIDFYQGLKKAYYLVWTLSALMLIWGLTALLPSSSSSAKMKTVSATYTRMRTGQDSGEDRLALMQALALAGLESRDSAWVEFRAFVDCVGVNARPDLDKPLVVWRWSSSGKNFEIAQGEILYIHPESLAKATPATKDSATVGFLMKRAFHEASQMVVELEILKRKGDHFESVETFKLVRPLSGAPGDTTLSVLKRMQVKWYGPDEFLMEHGDAGEDWKSIQRLEFMTAGKAEMVVLLPGQALVKQKQSMISQNLGTLTQGMPIWVVEDVEPSGLRFRAWSLSGLYSETMVLPRQSEQWSSKNLQDQISLSGVRSSQQISIRIQDQRWNLQLNDWMLHLPSGWIKITHPKQVDEYVEGRLVGELLILRAIEYDGDGYRAKLRLYSPLRSQKIDFFLKTLEGSTPAISGARPVEPGQIHNAEATPMPTEEYFVPLKKEPGQEDVWDPSDERAWQPPVDIHPHAMQEILRSMSQRQAD